MGADLRFQRIHVSDQLAGDPADATALVQSLEPLVLPAMAAAERAREEKLEGQRRWPNLEGAILIAINADLATMLKGLGDFTGSVDAAGSWFSDRPVVASFEWTDGELKNLKFCQALVRGSWETVVRAAPRIGSAGGAQ
jgi:hypothetical protein